MVNQLGKNYSELALSHFFWLVLSGGILFISSLIGITIGPSIQADLLSDIYSTLVTAVATVLAISFSVLFISTQIASERYSPSFTVTFINDPIVKLGFGLGIFCILSNILTFLLSYRIHRLLDIGSGTMLSGLYWGMGGLLVGVNITFFVLLYPFIRLILIQTTPENLLAQFNRQYNTSRYANEADAADKVSDHPMQPVYDFSRNSIYKKDYSAAIAGINSLFSLPISLMYDLSDMENIENEDLYNPILSHYAPSLIKLSDDTGFDDGVSSVCEGIVDLGSTASEINDSELFQDAFSRSYILFSEDDGFDSNTRQVLANCCGELFQSAINSPEIFRETIPRVSRLLNDIEATECELYLQTFLKNMVDVHNRVLDSTNELAIKIRKEEVLLGKKEKKPVWKTANSSEHVALLQCTHLIMQTTSAILEVIDRQEPPGLLYKQWESLIEHSHSVGLEIHVQYLLRRYIELLLYTEQNFDMEISTSNRLSDLSQTKDLDEAVIAACDSILSENRTTSEMNGFRFLESNLPEVWSPVPLSEFSDEFLEEVKGIKSKVM